MGLGESDFHYVFETLPENKSACLCPKSTHAFPIKWPRPPTIEPPGIETNLVSNNQQKYFEQSFITYYNEIRRLSVL